MAARRRTRTIWIVAVSVVLGGAIAAAAALVVPWVIAETEPHTADGVEAVVLRQSEAEVAITPGSGWLVHPRFASDSTVDLVTPDQALTIEVEVVPDEIGAALTRLVDDAADTPVDPSGVPGAPDASATDTDTGDAGSGAPASIETLASGLELRHVPTEHGLLAVVGTASGSVTLTVRAGREVELADYRAALSALLETVRAT